MKVKVTRSYQITIPSEIRKKLGIEIGDMLTVKLEDDRIILEKPKALLPSIKLKKRLRTSEIEKLIEESLEEVVG